MNETSTFFNQAIPLHTSTPIAPIQNDTKYDLSLVDKEFKI